MWQLQVSKSSKRSSKSTKTFRSVDDDRALKIVRLFDDMEELRQKAQNRVKKRNKVEAHLEDHKATMKRELYKLLEKVRSGKEDMECLDAFCEEHRKKAEEIFPPEDRNDEATQP